MRSSSPARTPKLQLAAEQPLTGECWIPPKKKIPHTQWQRRSPSKTVGTHGQVWVSLLWGYCSFLLEKHTSFCLCPPRVCFPVLCKFWQLYGRVNGHLLQESLCNTHVCCTQSLCPCGRPLLTCTSSRDTQTRFCLSLCGISGNLSFRDGHNKGQKWYGPNRSRRY